MFQKFSPPRLGAFAREYSGRQDGAFAPEVWVRSASRPYLGIFDSRRFASFAGEPLSLRGGWNFVCGGQQGTVSGRPLSRGLIFRRNGPAVLIHSSGVGYSEADSAKQEANMSVSSPFAS